jgi:hypothetical protein
VHEKGGEAWDTYLVEHYGPGSSADTLRRSARDVRQTTAEMTRRGRPVSCVCSTIVPGDEAFFATFEAGSEALVREAYARAGVGLERISQAIHSDGRDVST